MERTIILLPIRPIGEAIPNGHVSLVGDQRCQQRWRRFGWIRVIAIDHDVVFGNDVTQHLTHDVALALTDLLAHHSAMLGSYLGRPIGRVVVIYIDDGPGQTPLEVIHDLGDGDCLVVTWHENGYLAIRSATNVIYHHSSTPSQSGTMSFC